MIALLLLILDLAMHSFLQQHVIYTVFGYTLAYLLNKNSYWQHFEWYETLACLLIEDFIMYDRIGLILVIIAPLFLLIKTLKDMLLHARIVLFFTCFFIFFIAHDLIITKIFLDHFVINSVTISKIFNNLMIGYLIFWGTQGNRPLIIKGRKVWTPNRKDAS